MYASRLCIYVLWSGKGFFFFYIWTLCQWRKCRRKIACRHHWNTSESEGWESRESDLSCCGCVLWVRNCFPTVFQYRVALWFYTCVSCIFNHIVFVSCLKILKRVWLLWIYIIFLPLLHTWVYFVQMIFCVCFCSKITAEGVSAVNVYNVAFQYMHMLLL
jgi:hypothetical protein